MKIHAVPQRSAEWHALRLGKLTSSDAAVIYAQGRSKGTESTQRRNLRLALALQRITGRVADSFTTAAMQDGIEREAEARRRYSAISGEWVDETGFCEHDTLAAGASVDGHTPDFSGLVEVKCPQPAAHFDFLNTGIIPQDYTHQITHQAWITGAAWTDFVSYNPDFPEHLQMRIERVETRLLDLDAHAEAVEKFLEEVDAVAKQIQEMKAA